MELKQNITESEPELERNSSWSETEPKRNWNITEPKVKQNLNKTEPKLKTEPKRDSTWTTQTNLKRSKNKTARYLGQQFTSFEIK